MNLSEFENEPVITKSSNTINDESKITIKKHNRIPKDYELNQVRSRKSWEDKKSLFFSIISPVYRIQSSEMSQTNDQEPLQYNIIKT